MFNVIILKCNQTEHHPVQVRGMSKKSMGGRWAGICVSTPTPAAGKWFIGKERALLPCMCHGSPPACVDVTEFM